MFSIIRFTVRAVVRPGIPRPWQHRHYATARGALGDAKELARLIGRPVAVIDGSRPPSIIAVVWPDGLVDMDYYGKARR